MKLLLKILALPFLLSIAFSSCRNEEDPDLTPGEPTAKKNILLIIADDMGVDATPGYSIGNMKPHMPHLDSLARNGLSFDNVWSYPVCSPTRASILSGKYGYRTGVLNAEDKSTIDASEKTLQAHLDERLGKAYAHAIIGKWHLSNMEPSRPVQMGIDHYEGLLGGGVSDYNRWRLVQNGQSMISNEYITSKFTDLAIEWIQQQDDPWFCWLAYTTPHTPLHLPPLDMHSQGSLPTDSASIASNPMPYFLAMCESLDHEIGRVLDSIPDEELENTVIIFLGDNGTAGNTLQAPYTSGQGKGSLYQGGINVPMIISGKGVLRLNQRDTNLIHTADLFSTIIEIADAAQPFYQDSYSFEPLLSGAGLGPRVINYSESDNGNPNRSGYTIRTTQYKLLEFDNGRSEYYDLFADPYEQNDLLLGNLNTQEQTALNALRTEATAIRK